MGNKKAPWKLVVSMHTSTFSMIAQIRSRPAPVVSARAFVSGSTAWHRAFRFRQYLRSMKMTDGEQPDLLLLSSRALIRRVCVV